MWYDFAFAILKLVWYSLQAILVNLVIDLQLKWHLLLEQGRGPS